MSVSMESQLQDRAKQDMVSRSNTKDDIPASIRDAPIFSHNDIQWQSSPSVALQEIPTAVWLPAQIDWTQPQVVAFGEPLPTETDAVECRRCNVPVHNFVLDDTWTRISQYGAQQWVSSCLRTYLSTDVASIVSGFFVTTTIQGLDNRVRIYSPPLFLDCDCELLVVTTKTQVQKFNRCAHEHCNDDDDAIKLDLQRFRYMKKHNGRVNDFLETASLSSEFCGTDCRVEYFSKHKDDKTPNITRAAEIQGHLDVKHSNPLATCLVIGGGIQNVSIHAQALVMARKVSTGEWMHLDHAGLRGLVELILKPVRPCRAFDLLRDNYTNKNSSVPFSGVYISADSKFQRYSFKTRADLKQQLYAHSNTCCFRTAIQLHDKALVVRPTYMTQDSVGKYGCEENLYLCVERQFRGGAQHTCLNSVGHKVLEKLTMMDKKEPRNEAASKLCGTDIYGDVFVWGEDYVGFYSISLDDINRWL